MKFSEYKINSTPATKAAVSRLKYLRKHLSREYSPLRGFLNKYYGKDKMLKEQYDKLCNKIFDYINTSNLPQDVKDSILIWETFQSKQKGATAPITTEVFDQNILGDIIIKPFELDVEIVSTIQDVFESLMNYLRQFCSLDVLSLKPDVEWANLPNTTVRGFPFNSKGSQVDHEILKLGGKTMHDALKYYKWSDDFICFSGFRVQGKPYPGPAKLRLVFIPPVHSQYLDNALVSESMRQLKKCPIFSTWLEPNLRQEVLNRQNIQAYVKGHTRIQLDWSKFDKNIHPIFQKLVGKYFSYVSNNGFDIISERYEQFIKFRDNQYVLLPNNRNVPTFYKIPYQLPSGEKRTQHDGSMIGLILQGVSYKLLFGEEIPWDLCSQAGDDALWPVPTSYLTRWGYKHLLEKASEINRRMGFQLNSSKAYPNSDGAFLQKLYSYEKKINGIGSFTRSLASFIWKEKFSKRIKGVENFWALELISQITILSEPFSNSFYNIHDVAKHLVDWWLSEDDYLASCIQFLRKKGQLTPNSLFKLLIKLVGINSEILFEQLINKSYDHKGLLNALTSEDYGKVFPILNYLIESEVSSRSLKDFHKLKDISIFSENSKVDEYIGGDD